MVGRNLHPRPRALLLCLCAAGVVTGAVVASRVAVPRDRPAPEPEGATPAPAAPQPAPPPPPAPPAAVAGPAPSAPQPPPAAAPPRRKASPRAATPPDRPVDFSRDVRPILSEYCYACHGPAEEGRKADLRLDVPDDAARETATGRAVIKPGDPAGSELIARVLAEGAGAMPPAKFGKKLTAAQVGVLRRWVAEGAGYTPHWAYARPVAHAPPPVRGPGVARNAIDAFVLSRLEKAGLSPSPEADRAALIRRLSLGLTGLPPAPAEVDAFLADPAPDAYERLVDRLLASPHYGERMAPAWLDLARYADTNGGTVDNGREMWPYRDWVIQALNDNLPFDRFTVEQLAGDLLPGPALSQKVATGFLRNEAARFEACPDNASTLLLIDRANTVATAWLGMTAACAQCHDHKSDPLTQRDYYRLLAFFNNHPKGVLQGVDPRGNRFPVVSFPTPAQSARLARVRDLSGQVEREIELLVAATPVPVEAPAAPAEVVWVDDALPRGARLAPGSPGWDFSPGRPPPFRGRAAVRVPADAPGFRGFEGAADPLAVGRGDTLFAYVYLDPAAPPAAVLVQFQDVHPEHRAYWGEDRFPWGQDGQPGRRRIGPLPPPGQWVRLEVPAESVGLAGSAVTGVTFAVSGGTAHWDCVGVARSARADTFPAWERAERAAPGPDLPAPVRDALKADPAARTAKQAEDLRRYYVEYVHPPTRARFARLRAERDRLRAEVEAVNAEVTSTMVMDQPREQPETHVLVRGEPGRKGERVAPGVPGFLPPLPAGAKADRLAFARWLTAPDHPLTARVAVNRIWQGHFGTGLVPSGDDFGAQGEPPTHPELLDWLAVRFVESGWDVKALHRLIVSSATYRQSARVTPELAEADPNNRLYGRWPRPRLPAETVRDNALAVGGLLDRRVGGPSVRPYQPDGLWEAIRHPGDTSAQVYEQSHGPDLYRRGVYVFAKRTMPHPALSLFDGVNRDLCVGRRYVTNTALQALVLLNDTTAVECARGAAVRMYRAGGHLDYQLAYGFRLCTARPPRPPELDVLRRLYAAELGRFRADPRAAEALLRVGESPAPRDVPAAELAALTVVGNLLLNLDETITLE